MSSKEKHSWIWPNAGSSPQQRKSEADSFQGQIAKDIINLIREATQNTLDASEQQAKISFQYHESNQARKYSQYFSGLKSFIKTSNKQERAATDISDEQFEHPDWIVIQDYDTGGIDGEPNDTRQDNPLWEFLLNWGKSNKNETRAVRGSKGEGRQTFLFASKIKAAFVLTFKANQQRILAGFAFLNPTQVDNEYRSSQAIFAKEELPPVYKLHSGDVNGVSDEESGFVDKFESHFKVDAEDDQTGTAIIIPLPIDKVKEQFLDYAAAGLIENFAPAIIREDLAATVGDKELSFQNIENLARDLRENFSGEYLAFKRNAPQYIRFLNSALHEDNTLEINVSDSIIFDEETIEESQRELIHKTYQEKGIVKVQFKFSIKRSINQKVKNFSTHIEAVLGAPDSPSQGVEMYFRSGMTISRQKRRCGPNFHAALFCNDKPISDLLNASEDTGHTEWVRGSTKIGEMGFDPIQGSDAVKFCAYSLRNIVKTCFEDGASENLEAFDDLFLFDTDDVDARYRRESRPTTNDPTPTPAPTPAPTPSPGEPPCHEIRDLRDGFCIKHIEGTKLPSAITVTLVYKQDPSLAKSKSNHDFNNIACQTDGCDVEEMTSRGKLRFKLINLASNFSCDVTNFNTDLEVEVVTRVSRDQS